MRRLTDTWLLTRRALMETIRQPGNEAVNAFIPLFFFVVTVGAIGSIAQQSFGIDDYKGFQMPVAVLQGVAGVASGAGLAMTLDIQSGYFEKLLLTSAPRSSIVMGRMFGDAIKGTILSAAIIALAMAMGSGFETGLAGMGVLLVGAFFFGLGYSGIGMAIALKTGSPQAANAGFVIFFPLLFLAPTFAPIEVFADWLAAIARINPVTYILEASRSLIIDGWDGPALAKGAAAIAGICAFTFTLTGLALRSRRG